MTLAPGESSQVDWNNIQPEQVGNYDGKPQAWKETSQTPQALLHETDWNGDVIVVNAPSPQLLPAPTLLPERVSPRLRDWCVAKGGCSRDGGFPSIRSGGLNLFSLKRPSIPRRSTLTAPCLARIRSLTHSVSFLHRESPFARGATLNSAADSSRRDFLRLTGQAAAGAALATLPLPRGYHTAALSAAFPDRTGPVPEAIARGLMDAGVRVATCVPATGGWEVFSRFQAGRGTEPLASLNEEPAFALAHGAALTGSRAVTILKSHGLAKAGNTAIDSLTAGTTAGFLVVVTEDPRGKHSDSIFDLKPFLEGLGLPYKRPNSEDFYRETVDAILWSEALGLPVVLFVDVEALDAPVSFTPLDVPAFQGEYRRDPYLHVLCPPLARYQNQLLQARLEGRSTEGLSRPALKVELEALPPAWRETVASYRPFFEVFRGLRGPGSFVAGDTGVSSLYAFSPFEAIDACTYYGGSVPLAAGALAGGTEEAWAITGDFAFAAAGHLGLHECLVRDLPVKAVVLHNGRAMTTGGQTMDPRVLQGILGGFRTHVHTIQNPADTSEVSEVLTRVTRSDRMEIVVAEYPKEAK